MWKAALYDYFWQLSCDLYYIRVGAQKGFASFEVWHWPRDFRAEALTRPAMSHGCKSFPKLCKVFEFLFGVFWFFSYFLILLPLVLLRFAFSLFSVSHFKVFRYCCKYFVKNGIQSVSKMLLHQVCWQSQKLTLVKKGGGSQLPRVKSIVNWPKSQVFMDGATGQRGPVKSFFITNPGKISPMQQMSIVSPDKVMPQNEVFSFAMPCNCYN